MKLLALLFSLLALSWLQTANSTHLETCECHQIRDLVNTTVQEALAGLEDRLETLRLFGTNSTDRHDLDLLESRLTATIKGLLKPIQRQLDYHPPGPILIGSKDKPAASCKDLLKKHPQAPSGYYWIKQSGSAVRVYCSMSGTCGSETGGWMRVANIDMRNTSQSCPSGLTLISSPKRLCDITRDGCVSNTFSVQGLQYSKVCGKITAYHNRVPLAFHYGSSGIEGSYVYGASLTHSHNPRRHIWTFAGASDETTNHPSYKCPCINSALTSSQVPNFVGNDYFCDTALSGYFAQTSNPLRPYNPLWDGKGCSRSNTCCSFNTPPWFVKNLPSKTSANIEMRMCRPNSDGTTPLELVELYIQ